MYWYYSISSSRQGVKVALFLLNKMEAEGPIGLFIFITSTTIHAKLMP